MSSFVDLITLYLILPLNVTIMKNKELKLVEIGVRHLTHYSNYAIFSVRLGVASWEPTRWE